MRSRRLVAASAALLALVAAAPPRPALADDTSGMDPLQALLLLPGVIQGLTIDRADMLRCPELAGGTAGIPELGPRRERGPDEGNPLDAGDATDAPRSLPRQVHLRSTRESFNRRYQFAVARGTVWYRSNTEVTGIAEPWAALPIPDCFDGRIAGVAVDDDEVLAIDEDRWVYTMDGALGTPSDFNWTLRWGPPLWTGPGRKLPASATDWDWSVVSIREDGGYLDTAGNEQAIGLGKVSHMWMLSHGGRRMTYLDPWLPSDESYEMCAPERGRFRAVDLASSGSLVAVISEHGDVFTRFYDFDMAGADPLFYKYAYDDQAGVKNPKVQLPSFPWVEQPKVPGAVTGRISVHKVGPGLVHRILRIEGRHAGRTGYWQKDVAAAGWHFVATGDPLAGRPLDNPAADTSRRDLAASEDRRYSGSAGGAAVVVRDFNTYCSPAHVWVTLPTGERFTLTLHTTDTIRQARRARGLDDHRRRIEGALEIPDALRSGDPEVKAYVDALGDERFVSADIDATLDALRFVDQGWRLAHRP
ncbi:hypothetical protein F0U44_20990 [Nocardioides humilatus]|uniref:Secreted protein n=1 Tax=Nocardioides humilatus TaxID=2607660 RepID=A0A5B1L4U5_9ACTN|nr:hypothetical protein [Nocardioides humilatus]KAA1415466.1 hypothetical protein F0U44_20990 [Nocardioides humilatus]